MALNRLITSRPSELIVVLLEEESDKSELEAALAAEAIEERLFSRVVSALCAEEMSPFDNAVDVLDRNVPNGLLKSAAAGISFFTSDKEACAEQISPDWIADIKVERVASNTFSLLDEVLDDKKVDEDSAVADADRSEYSEVFCKLEICITLSPFSMRFS